MIKDEDSLCRRAQLANHQMNGQTENKLPVLTNEVEFSGKLQSLWPTSVPKFLAFGFQSVPIQSLNDPRTGSHL